MDVGGLPRVDDTAGVGQDLRVPQRRLDDVSLPESACPSGSVNSARPATSRTARCDGASSCPAPASRSTIRVPAARPSGAVGRRPGTHRSTALASTTSVSGCGSQVVTSPRVASRPRRRAASTISGELSDASMVASGQRCRSVTVRFPPQPRSTTWRGDSAPTRPTRSKNGRPRWSAKDGYCSRFHVTPLFNAVP